MTAGMSIVAKTDYGEIRVTAGKGLRRTYTWDGASRSAKLWPRREHRWYGSFGAYYPGPGLHWKQHRGIKRGVLEEGQQHFESIEQAIAWLRLPHHADCVYRNDGLVVCFSKNLSRYQLNVAVWQIYVEAKTLSPYQEGAGDRIWVRDEKDRPEIFRGSRNMPSTIGGRKPTALPGSQDERIVVVGGNGQPR